MALVTHCPHCGGDLDGATDGRATVWRYRLRLYDMWQQPDTPMPGADSAPDREQDQDGEDVMIGLPALMTLVAAQSVAYHDAQLIGMGHHDLERKIRGIRPTLSRRGGRATIRIEYDTLASFSEATDHSPRYLARVDIVKTGQGNEATEIQP